MWLYPSDQWTKLVKQIEKINAFTNDEIAMRRQMLFYTEECSIDSQHRILIPQKLLDKVAIGKEVLLIGQLERIELWNEEQFQNYLKGRPDNYEDVMDKVMRNVSSDNS